MHIKTKSHNQMLPFSVVLRHTFLLLEKHFLHFLLAIALPLSLSYIFYWIAVMVIVNNINTASSLADLQQFISLHSGTFYILLFTLLLVAFTSIVGLLAGPVVAVHHRTIQYKEIFSKVLQYFGSYVVLLLWMGVLLLPAILVSYFLLAIVLAMLGSIERELIDTWYTPLSYWIPSAMLALFNFFFIFAPYILVEEHQGAWQAIKKSAVLVGHHFWGLLIRSSILFLTLSIVTFILFYIPVVGFALSILVNTILLTVYNYILYQDVRS